MLGCDGLWTVYSKEMATDYVRTRLLAHDRHHNLAAAATDAEAVNAAAAATATGGGAATGGAATSSSTATAVGGSSVETPGGGGARGGSTGTTTPVRGEGEGGCSRRDCVLPEHHWNLSSVTRSLVDDAIHEKGCQDNVTALVVLIE